MIQHGGRVHHHNTRNRGACGHDALAPVQSNPIRNLNLHVDRSTLHRKNAELVLCPAAAFAPSSRPAPAARVAASRGHRRPTGAAPQRPAWQVCRSAAAAGVGRPSSPGTLSLLLLSARCANFGWQDWENPQCADDQLVMLDDALWAVVIDHNWGPLDSPEWHDWLIKARLADQGSACVVDAHSSGWQDSRRSHGLVAVVCRDPGPDVGHGTTIVRRVTRANVIRGATSRSPAGHDRRATKVRVGLQGWLTQRVV